MLNITEQPVESDIDSTLAIEFHGGLRTCRRYCARGPPVLCCQNQAKVS